MLEQVPDLDVVVVPVGGGGLIGGVACALKSRKPSIQVIGVEPSVMPSMKRSVQAGELCQVAAAPTIAEGLAVRKPGALTFELVKRYVDQIVTVDEEEIANAILLLLERDKTVAEGAGAAGLAALINSRIPQARDRRVGVILCGGNIDVNLISRIIERGLVKDGRLVRAPPSPPNSRL